MKILSVIGFGCTAVELQRLERQLPDSFVMNEYGALMEL
jgi:hypothetical protein